MHELGWLGLLKVFTKISLSNKTLNMKNGYLVMGQKFIQNILFQFS